MKLLVVEEDKKIADYITKGLKQAGFAVDYAADGEKGLDLALSMTYHAAVVDAMLPKLDGLALIQKLRKRDIRLPIIILSAKRSVNDRVEGLQRGGDDYLTKPFSFSELLARVEALIRREGRTAESTTLTVGDLSLDLLTRQAFRDGRKIDLKLREFTLLGYMMRRAGHVLSKTLILENVWDYDFDPQTNVVDVLVCRLRNKMDHGFNKKMIWTMRGLGYVLKP